MFFPPRKVLVVGATGQQGSAVLAELSQLVTANASSQGGSSRPPALKVLALTRKASSKKAQALVPKYGGTREVLDLEVVEGDTRDPEPIFAAHEDIDAVFSYTTPIWDEEAQARPLIDAAARHGVKRFVFSSIERGGEARSWENPTDVPHFVTKHNIEHYLRKTCAESPSMTYTILRPVAFMDNLNPTSGFGPVMAATWHTLPSSTKLQLVSVRDIGVFGAKALWYPEIYENRAISLAGDELTLLDARSIFRRVTGTQLPQAWTIVGYVFRWLVHDVGKMFDFFEKEGYKADIQELKAAEPRLQDFETWLKESSTFESAKEKK
ncbi:hypothetical protein SAMD00023353_10100050 [Rosellinia necatrix]|uniref:NmrA-like domain-containing protein n=1 Tax=Rosellinia necatrix TaxID=77044 RepID=A0A1W2TUF9_ROSNE|nr:hypothetical protein SAMD00023353_10100050 [Rosellinia necatrix]